ncbi:MAG TPA: TadE/TadG family type IV pilus assembly protein, partial [Vicinamibacterales bacterium]|nr:TadE/TadG family type IV pilus assembly protein [Vicinamibacterales bacterium]
MTKLNASRLRRRLACENGQAVLEFALVVPLVLVLVLGVVEVSYALLDQHIVSKLTREGSNLISRDTSLADAATAMTNMSSRPVNFTDGSSTVIFSVVKNVATVGASNYG